MNISHLVVTGIVAFLVTLSLNSMVEYFARDKSAAILGPSLSLHGKKYFTVAVSNYDHDALHSLVVSVPASTTVSSIISSSPLHISSTSDNTGNEDLSRITVEGIPPRQTTLLLLPLTAQSDEAAFTIYNSASLGMTVETYRDRGSILRDTVTRLLTMTFVSTLFYLLALAALEEKEAAHKRRVEEVKLELATLKDKTEKDGRAQDEKFSKLVHKTEIGAKSADRLRLLLLARLADYSKELSFWRDTIRKLLGRKGSTDADDLVKCVTDSLRTYGTLHDDQMNYKSIEVLADVVRRPLTSEPRDE